jgi:urea transporter
MRTRQFIRVAALSVAGAAVLAITAPWLNPCIGASRFTDCIDPNSPQADGQSPERSCYLGVCDFFPSVGETLSRILVVLLVVSGVAFLVGRTVTGQRVVYAAVAALVSAALAMAITWYAYPYASSHG